MKFALLSGALPPSPSGQSMMLYRLLSGLDPADYCLIARSFLGLGPDDSAFTARLPTRYYSLDDSPVTREPIWWRRLKTLGRLFVRRRRIVEILRAERCEAVVVCSGDLLDLPAALLASRRLGLPCYFYLFDDYTYHSFGARRWCARLFESLCLGRVTAVIAINEFLRDEMLRRHGAIETLVLLNPCAVTFPPPGVFRPIPAGEEEIRIVFTGAIYDAHYDAFRNLIAALRLLTSRRIALHLYTAVSSTELARHGIAGPVVCHAHQSLDAVPALQQQADLLFLPLGFETPYPELIKTTSPSKMSEYLAAGRPILVHSPPDCYMTWYFRHHDCGVVVDEPEPARLAVAIEALIADPRRQEELALRGRGRAEIDCDLGAARAKFAGLLHVSLGESPADDRSARPASR